MQSIEEFEVWVKTKGGQKALAAAFSKRFPKEKPISQTAVSNWVTRRLIPAERRAQLKILGWDGPWEWPAEPAPPANGVTREEFLKLETALAVHVSYWQSGEKEVLKSLLELGQRIAAIERRLDSLD